MMGKCRISSGNQSLFQIGQRTLAKYFPIRVLTKIGLVLDSYPSEQEKKKDKDKLGFIKNEIREEGEILQRIEGEANLMEGFGTLDR